VGLARPFVCVGPRAVPGAGYAVPPLGLVGLRGQPHPGAESGVASAPQADPDHQLRQYVAFGQDPPFRSHGIITVGKDL